MMRKRLISVLLLGAALAAYAGPKEDIQADMQAGRWVAADQRLDTVLKKHPRNALALYWRAQVKAQEGDLVQAQADLVAARVIDPGESFVSNRALLQALESKIGAAGSRATTGVTTAAEPVGLPAPAEVGSEVAQAPIDVQFASAVPDMSVVAGVVLIAVCLVLLRAGWRDRRSRARSEGDRLVGKIDLAKVDLQDAIKASDGNVGLSPEAKLGNYDRCMAAINLLNGLRAAAAGKGGMRGMGMEVDAAVEHARGVARSVRGEKARVPEVSRAAPSLGSRAMGFSSTAPSAPPQSMSTGGGFTEGLIMGQLFEQERSPAASSTPAPMDSWSLNGARGDTGFGVDVGGSASGGSDPSFDLGSGGSDNSFV